MRPGTRSGLWSYQADAVSILQPQLVIWENVLGALSGGASSRYDTTRPDCLRALGRVLGDLTGLGCDAVWTVMGTPHHRRRLFVLAFHHDPLPRLTDAPSATWDPRLDIWVTGRDLFDQTVPYTDPRPMAGWVSGGVAGMLTPRPGSRCRPAADAHQPGERRPQRPAVSCPIVNS